MAEPCSCGHKGEGPHPCHACGQPATSRLYQPRLVSLAGRFMKAEMRETWACDVCWAEYMAQRAEVRRG